MLVHNIILHVLQSSKNCKNQIIIQKYEIVNYLLNIYHYKYKFNKKIQYFR